MNSREYWRKREERWIKEQIRNDMELKKKINQVMNDSYDEIQKDIDSFYAKYATAEGIDIATARQRVSNHDVQKFAKQAKKYVEDKDFSPRANKELRLYNLTMKVNRLELLKAKIDLVATGSADEVDKIVTDDTYKRTVAQLERNAGILGSSTRFDVEQRAFQIITGSYKLKDTETMATFSDNIWQYKDELVKDTEKLLISNFTKGENPRVMARQLKDKFNVFGYQAERLARTESSRIQTEIQKQSFEDNAIDEYELIAEPNACSICAFLDGEIFSVEQMVIGKNASPLHPNCRCSEAPHTDPTHMYIDWLKRGIISADEYNSQMAFREDYDNKFEKLMDKMKRNKTPKDTVRTSEETANKFKEVLKDIDYSKSRKAIAKKVLQNLGLGDIPVHVKMIDPNGYCQIKQNSDGTVDIQDYVLDSGDTRSKDYKIKTTFHEAYHAMNHKRQSDWKTGNYNDLGWLDIEETFAETSAHYAMKQAGITKQITPAYPQKLVNVLPRLKRLDKFKNANKLSDFGEIAWGDRLDGQASTWEELANEASAIDHDWVSYGAQYSKYIRENEQMLQDQMLQNMPKYDNDYVRGLMMDDLHNALDKAERGEQLIDNEPMVFSNILSIAMDNIGVK